MDIEAKELLKTYGKGESRVTALDHVSLKIEEGDFISIIGPSGSGKSTLLHLLSGLDRPTSGQLTYDSKNIYDLTDKELSAFRRQRIGFIFQQFHLLPVLTARENILMPLLLDKKQPNEEHLDQLAQMLGIRERLSHLPSQLSGGQQQRVAIARALIARPEVIFADEPGEKLPVLLSMGGYDGYFSVGNSGFVNGIQVLVSDRIYERLTGTDTYAELRPSLRDGADREAFDRMLEELCQGTPGTTVVSYEQTDRQLAESEAQIKLLAWGLILFISLIGILNIINTVYTNIHTRVAEIGVQRAIGMSAGSLYQVFLWEGIYYGIIAAVIGSIAGYTGTVLVEAATVNELRLTTVPVIPMALAAILSVGVCMAATAIPLRRIGRISIVDSIETVE